MLECGENSSSMRSVRIQMLECGDTNVRMWGEFWLNEVCGDTKNKNKNSLLSKYIEIHWKLLFSAH